MRLCRPTWLAFSLAFALLALHGECLAQSRSKRKDREAEPKIVSKDQSRRSPFLQPPGTDRYEPDGTDWSTIPPWGQTEFFGIRAKGQLFVYVVDCSGSMIEESRLVRAKIELRKSILRLQSPQRFKVIFYNDQPIPISGELPNSADQLSKDQLIHWLRAIEPDGGTDPRAALALALALRPDAIFLLSDGEYPERTAESIAKKNPKKIPIHCIDLSGGAGGDQLQKIARDSGGQYRSRPRIAAPR